MTELSGRPIGFATVLMAELRFLLALRWIGILLLMVAAFAVNDVVSRSGRFLNLPPWALLALMAVVWASIVWSGERPGERECFAGAPVPVAWHEIARVLAGAVCLALPVASMLVGQAVFETPFGPHYGVGYVVASFTGPLTFYLLASCLALVSAWPAAWFTGMFMVLSYTPWWGYYMPAFMRRLLGNGRWGFFASMTPVGDGWQQPLDWRVRGPAVSLYLAGSLALLIVVAHGRAVRRLPYGQSPPPRGARAATAAANLAA